MTDRVREGLAKIIADCEAFGDEPSLDDLRELLMPAHRAGDIVRVSEYVADLIWIRKITYEEGLRQVHEEIRDGKFRLTSTFDLEFQ